MSDVSTVISIGSLNLNDVDTINKEIAKYPGYKPFSGYSYIGRSYVLLNKVDSNDKYEVDIIDLKFVNSINDLNTWLSEHPGWQPLAISTLNGKSWAYVYRTL